MEKYSHSHGNSLDTAYALCESHRKMAELGMYSMAVCLHSTPRLQADHFLNCWHLNYQKIMLYYCPLTCDSHAWADQLHRHQWNGADSWGSRTQSNIYYTDYVFSECEFEIWMKTSSGFDREALLWIQIWEFESVTTLQPPVSSFTCVYFVGTENNNDTGFPQTCQMTSYGVELQVHIPFWICYRIIKAVMSAPGAVTSTL